MGYPQRLVLSLTDLIQTTAAAFDVRTGQMIEASTYYPNGARETYLNDPDATAAELTAPEPSGFTGKEADEEVGLVYFGERYLIPRIGRWASPDPLHVHANGGGEALNSYHYVAGNMLAARDPLGLNPAMGEPGWAREHRLRREENRGLQDLLQPQFERLTRTRSTMRSLAQIFRENSGDHVLRGLSGTCQRV